MNKQGYVYVLINPSLEGLVKIGKTQKNPEERAKELSSATGVPTPFLIVYHKFFEDCDRAEIYVHTRLEGHRVSGNREFFRVSLPVAIDILADAEREFALSSNNHLPQTDSFKEQTPDQFLESLNLDPDSPCREIYDAADRYYYGLEDTIQDYFEAFKLYNQAVKLGCGYAYLQIGKMQLEGEGSSKSFHKALEAFKAGAREGDLRCWAEMALLFYDQGHFDNCFKCWDRYFESPHFKENITYGIGSESDRGRYSCEYVEHVLKTGRTLAHKEILSIKQEMINWWEMLIKYTVEHAGTIDVSRFRKRIEYFRNLK